MLEEMGVVGEVFVNVGGVFVVVVGVIVVLL